jgi:hypothetical protein
MFMQWQTIIVQRSTEGLGAAGEYRRLVRCRQL